MISIIIPTYNEIENIDPLIKAIKVILAKYNYEIIFVDDNSPDNTASKIKNIASSNNSIRCIKRIGRRGLSSAVIEGILSSSAQLIIVMDGDMQHDESILPTMIEMLIDEKLDIIVASRFSSGSSFDSFTIIRKTISNIGIFLAKKITGVKLADPMSGFFIIKRDVFDEVAPNLTGLGFKILLDIFAASKKNLNFKEIGFKFKDRKSGVSKLDSLVIWEYLLMLWETKLGYFIPARFVSFCLIGTLGLFIHLLSLYILINLDQNFLVSQGISTFIAMTFNFFLNNLLTYRDIRLKGFLIIRGLVLFYLTCGIGAIANIGVANSMFIGKIPGTEGIWYLSGIVGAFVGVIWNFLMSSVLTWKRK